MSTRRERIEKEARIKAFVTNVVTGLIALAVLVCIYQIARAVSHSVGVYRVRTAVAREGFLDDSFTVQAVALQRESVQKAPSTGRLDNILIEGDRARKGSVLGRFYSDGARTQQVIKTENSGLICYHVDGMEGCYQGYSLGQDQGALLQREPEPYHEGSNFVPGEPIFKVVDNLSPTLLIARIPTDRACTVEQDFLLRMGQKDIGEATCKEIIRNQGRKIALLQAPGYIAPLLHHRKVKLNLVSHRYEGIVIPASALMQRKEQQGVFLLIGNTVRYKNVTVENAIGSRAVVNEIAPGDQVVVNPSLVRDGMMLPMGAGGQSE